MKKFLICFIFLSFINGFSQEDAWVYFNDKPNAQIFLDNPLSVLTQRALDRRQIQGITLSIEDAPIYQPCINEIFSSNGITIMAQSTSVI